MFRRLRGGAVVILTLVASAAAVVPATAETSKTGVTHTLTVAVAKTLPPAAEKKLSVLVLVTQNGGAPAGAVATSREPLTVHLANRGLYRVKAEIDATCKGSCVASYVIAGSANHKLEVVPNCHLAARGFVCTRIKIVRIS